jgi:hypothetical protein
MTKTVTPPEVQALLNDIGTCLSSYIDAEPSSHKHLDETWRTKVAELRGSLLASIPQAAPATTDKPADNTALLVALTSVKGMLSTFGEILQAKSTQVATALNSVPAEIQKGLDAKLTSGDYVKKEDAAALSSTARTEGEKTGFERGQLLGKRQLALASAGIPADVAASAPEAVLTADEAIFNTSKDTAVSRITKLGTVGLTLASSADVIKNLAWADETAFTVQFSTFEAIKNASKGQSINTAPKPVGQPNPFLSGTPIPAKEGDKPTKFVLAL